PACCLLKPQAGSLCYGKLAAALRASSWSGSEPDRPAQTLPAPGPARSAACRRTTLPVARTLYHGSTPGPPLAGRLPADWRAGARPARPSLTGLPRDFLLGAAPEAGGRPGRGTRSRPAA